MGLINVLLAADVGNTNISFGLYKNGVIQKTVSYPHNGDTNLHNIEKMISTFAEYQIDKCVISSVVDKMTLALREAIFKSLKFEPMVLTTDMEVGIKIKNAARCKYGIDRVANVCAASRLYKNRPIIVVDCGTATTFDIIDNNGFFIGGLIMPGFQTQLNSLGINTSRLPKLSLEMIDESDCVINTDTSKGILSGVVNGHAQAVQGLIVKCEKELTQKSYIIGTGGGATLLNKYMSKKFDVINPLLTLEGIKIIYELNSKD